jgi:hypothetical protein
LFTARELASSRQSPAYPVTAPVRTLVFAGVVGAGAGVCGGLVEAGATTGGWVGDGDEGGDEVAVGETAGVESSIGVSTDSDASDAEGAGETRRGPGAAFVADAVTADPPRLYIMTARTAAPRPRTVAPIAALRAPGGVNGQSRRVESTTVVRLSGLSA